MTRSLLLVSLAAGSLTAPVPASAAATELAIRAITVRPAAPVVGAHDSVSLVIDVIARGARGKNGVTVKVEPGAPPGPLLSSRPPVGDAPLVPGSSAPVLRNPAFPDPAYPGSTGAVAPGAAVPGPGGQDLADPANPDAAQDMAQDLAQDMARPPAVTHEAGPLTRRRQSPAPTPMAQQPAAPEAQQQNPHPLTVDANPRAGIMNGAPALAALPPRLVWRKAAPAARVPDDWQTWRFLPDKKLNRFYPTGTWTITATARGADGATVTEYASFQLRRATKLGSIRVEQAPKSSAGGVRLRGSLTRIDPRGYTDFGPYGRQRLEIQWRAEGSSTWEPVAVTTTDAAGAFVRTVPSRTGGHWRVRYPGSTHYAPDITKPRQITT